MARTGIVVGLVGGRRSGDAVEAAAELGRRHVSGSGAVAEVETAYAVAISDVLLFLRRKEGNINKVHVGSNRRRVDARRRLREAVR